RPAAPPADWRAAIRDARDDSRVRHGAARGVRRGGGPAPPPLRGHPRPDGGRGGGVVCRRRSARDALPRPRPGSRQPPCRTRLDCERRTSRLAASLGNLGTIAQMRGDRTTAVGYYAEAIEASRSAGDEDGTAVNLHNLARTELSLGRLEKGLEALRESLAIGQRLGY